MVVQMCDNRIDTAPDRRHRRRRAGDGCVMTQEQLDRLLEKVERNHDANIRGEHMEIRMQAVERTVKELCDRITRGMWAMICSLVIATGSLITAIWHVVTWIQELINHTILIS